MPRWGVPFEIQRPWLLVIVMYVALIFFVSSRPYLHAPGPDFQMKDKLAHAIEYGILGWLMSRAARPSRRVPTAIEVLWFVALGAGIAGLDELFQGSVPGRMMAVTDWIADVTGLAVGAALSVTRMRRVGATT
jgi:VanZ family protein